MARVAPEVETPVNPYSLLEAVNRSSDAAHTGWLIFLAIMAYFVIATAGVTHRDLLLETPVELPILQVKIQLTQFFQFAPIILALLHIGLMSQLVLLARETMEFDQAIRLLETTDKRTHPLRLELNNFFFVQAIAGPQRSAVLSTFLHGMSWLTLVTLPVVLILYIQVVFLPYHDVAITWTQRVALLLDLAALTLIGVFMLRTETSFFQAAVGTTRDSPFSCALTGMVLGLVAFFSLFVATVPGESIDRFVQSFFGEQTEDDTRPRYVSGFMAPFFAASADGKLFGLFERNLTVQDSDLVVDRDQAPGEPSISLRGRDLRFAKLDRSDMHQADLTGADLRRASLNGTDLRGAWLSCADPETLYLTTDRDAAGCASASRADFTKAKLDNANLLGIDLRRGKLEGASLGNANLSNAVLTGADLNSAHLEKASLEAVEAQGAQLLFARLQGANLNGARLQAANLSSSRLQGTYLRRADLRGADLSSADLEGATLELAMLQGANMTDAQIKAADFRGAGVWLTQPPQPDASGLADFTGLVMTAVTDADNVALKSDLGRIERPRLRREIETAMQPLFDTPTVQGWTSSVQNTQWQTLIGASTASAPDYQDKLTDYLMKLMCKIRWANGAVATGVALRAKTEGFRGQMVLLYDRSRMDDCSSSKTIDPDVLRDFGVAVDLARYN
ncbi:MAG: pentapeptide repeat-containing protein [Hyphomicrobiaceae bacterium]|nr:pentapeptide repeat-containing protein [Hyphomicrobiaceae bacterium]